MVFEKMQLITDKSAPVEVRRDTMLGLGRAGAEEALEAIVSVAFSPNDKPEARTSAVRAMAYFDKRTIFPLMLDILEPASENPVFLRNEAVASIYLLRDSRALFPLVNLYNRLDQEKEVERSFGYKILSAFWDIADPRAVGFLEEKAKSENKKTGELAGAALERSRNSGMTYTFNGSDQFIRHAKELVECPRISIDSAHLPEEPLQVFEQEASGDTCFGTYVVVPANPENASEGQSMLLGPRRTEHVFVAMGSDVLAAGEIGIGKNGFSVEYLDNHSGGYLPAPNSFFWAKKALDRAGIRHSLTGFSSLYPAEGYFTDDFLSTQLFYST